MELPGALSEPGGRDHGQAVPASRTGFPGPIFRGRSGNGNRGQVDCTMNGYRIAARLLEPHEPAKTALYGVAKRAADAGSPRN